MSNGAVEFVARVEHATKVVEHMKRDPSEYGYQKRQAIVAQADRAFGLFNEAFAKLDNIHERKRLQARMSGDRASLIVADRLLEIELFFALYEEELYLEHARFRQRHTTMPHIKLYPAIEDLSLLRDCKYANLVPFQ
jgi:hypothetical protein